MSKETAQGNLYTKIAELLQTARDQIVRSVNQTMVYTYYEIGRMIVEDEQQGKQRADYGRQILKDLSKRLAADFGKGFSVDNLQNMRQFYLILIQFWFSLARKLPMRQNSFFQPVCGVFQAKNG